MIRFVYKRYMIYTVALAELFFLGMFYLCAGHGWFALRHVQREKELLERDVCTLDAKIQHLTGAIAEFQSSDFGKEKIAREQLHMARPDDIVVYFAER